MYIAEELWWDYEAQNTENKHNAEYKERLKELCREEELLEAALSEEQKKMFERVSDAEWSLSAVTECEAFVRGLRCGGRLMLDILT